MSGTPQAIDEWVRGVLSAEAGQEPSSAQIADALAQAMRKLHAHLSRLIGGAGFDALLARAVSQARGQTPALSGLRAGPGGSFEGLHEALDGADAGEAEGIAAGVLHRLLALLATFVGADLALKLVKDVWPDVPAVEGDLEERGT